MLNKTLIKFLIIFTCYGHFSVNAAIENLLFAAGSDNGGLSSIQPIKRQSPSSSPPSAAAPVKSHHDATDEVIRSQRHGEGEHNDISSVTDSDKVPGVSTDTKYIVDYRDKRESNGMTSFYGNRISTIYKSNEGLYTEDVTNGDELSHPQQPVVISTDKDPANLSCVRGYRDIKVEDCQAPISSLQSWNFQEPPPKRPSSSRSCENYKGRKLPYGGIPEFCPNYTPRRRNWDTTAVCSGGELRDAFSPDSDKSVEADASESFGAYLRPTAVDGRNMNSSVVHKRQVKHPANPNGVGRHGGHPRPHQQQNVSNSTYGRPHSQQSRSFKQQVVARIKKGEKLIVLLRGLPGSGKSTLARELQYHGVILSADDYFIKNGTYEYDPAKLSEAHASSRKLARIAMQQCRTPIIIDNTNMEVWEMLPYVSEAMQFRYGIYCLEPETPWRYDPKVLAQKNSHNVGMNKIVRMLERFDFNVSVEKMARECKALSNHVHHSRPNPTLQQSAVFVRQTSKPPPRRKPAADPGNTISRAQSTKSRRPNMNVENRERHSEKGPAFSEKLQKATSVPNLHQNVPYALDPRNRDVADLIMFDAAPKLDSIPNSSEVQQWNTISSDWDDVAPDNTIVQQKEPTVCYSKIQANDTNLIDFGVLQVNDQPSAQREPAGASQKETLPWNQRTTPRCRGLAASFKDLNLKQNWEIPKYPSSQEVVTKADKCERPTGVEQYQDMSTVGMNLDHSVVSSRGEDDGHFELESTVGSMADLKSYFPMVPDEQLQDIYDKCQGNLHWILDLLLESGYDISHGVLSGNPLQCSGSSIEGMAEVSSEGSITSSALTDMALMESSDISSEPTFSKESIVSSVTIDQGVDSDLGTPLSSEGDSSNNKCQESLVMHIDPIFAMQLQKMFGPAGFHLSPGIPLLQSTSSLLKPYIHGLPPFSVSYYGSDLNITITADVARSIHNCWTDTLMANFKSEDEEFKKMSGMAIPILELFFPS